MSRLQPIDPARAVGRGRMLLAEVQQDLGFVPTLMRVLAHAPDALAGYLALRAALRGGTLPEPLREQIAIAVAAANGCDACLASHLEFGRAAGLSGVELEEATHARSTDPGMDAVFRFVGGLIETRGHVRADVLAGLQEAGFADAAIIEIVAGVALNLFANYINNLASVAR